MRAILFCGLLFVSALPPAAAQTPQPPARDRAAHVAAGSGSISGAVVSDEAAPQPLRRARVTLSASLSANRQIAITDDAGRFAFVGLPADRFTLTVTKDAYATAAFGAKRAGGPGTSIVLADGQNVSGLTIRLPRGAVISGTVVDQNGQPVEGVSVNAARYTFANTGERRLSPVRSSSTNDRGQYRLYGLAAGEYYVAAAPRVGGPSSGSDLRTITAADIARAKRELTGGTATQAAPGIQSRTTDPLSSGTGRAVAYAQVFYPSTVVQAQAAIVPVGKGEERSGIDIQLQLTPTSRVEGMVSVPDGTSPPDVTINLISSEQQGMPPLGIFEGFRTARPDRNGRFSFASVSPGAWLVTARATVPRGASGGAPAPPATLWARTEIVVDGNDVTNVALELLPGLTVSGRVQFEATELPPPDPSRLRVSMLPPPSASGVNLGVSATPASADGAFTLAGVTPGFYRITSTVPAGIPDVSRWMLKSSIVGGRDSLDTPVEIKGSVEGVVLTFTDRGTEVSGTLQDAAGHPASDYYIIVFPQDRSLWMPQSRRVQAVRPGHDGNYSIRHLPPGEYLLVAMTDVEVNEWHDRSFLERIAGAGMRFTLAEGERKRQDLRLGEQPR